MKAVDVMGAVVGVNAADSQLHLGQPPGGVVQLLAGDGDVPDPPAVGLDELFRLNKHPRGTPVGVVDPPPVGPEHLRQDLYDAAGGVELAAVVALGARERAEEVLADPSKVPGLVVAVSEVEVGGKVCQLPEALLVEGGTDVVRE